MSEIEALRAENATLKARVDRLERDCEEIMQERDDAEEAADALAYAIAPMEVIGEHSNANCPWDNAHEALDDVFAQLTASRAEAARIYECVTTDTRWPELRELLKEEFGDSGTLQWLQTNYVPRSEVEAMQREAVWKVLKIPTRTELLGGQHYKYIRLEEVLAVFPACACSACNGQGEIGGFINAESGYQTDPCPECSPLPSPPASRRRDV